MGKKSFITYNNFFIYACILVILSFSEVSIPLSFMSVKLVYIAEIPLIIFCIIDLAISKIKFSKFEIYNILWILSYLLAFNHILSYNDLYITLIGQITLFFLFYFIFRMKEKELIKLEKIYIFILICISLYGIFQVLLFITTGINLGVSHHDAFIGLPRPKSILSEPDWYGLCTAICFVYLYILNSEKISSITHRTKIFGIIISFIGLILSFTRASWVAVAVSIFIYYFIAGNFNRKFKFIIFLCFAILAYIFLLEVIELSNNQFMLKLYNRINIFKWLSNDGGATNSRIDSIKIMWYYIEKYPLTGNGTGSMNYIASNTQLLLQFGISWEINAGRGNANLFITNLFDNGIIGTIFLILSIIAYFVYMIDIYKKTKNKKIILYIIVYLTFLLDYQFNNGYRQAFFWIYIAISMGLTKYTKENKLLYKENLT